MRDTEESQPPPSEARPLSSEDSRAERLIDHMAVSWGRMPDYLAKRVDQWLREGHTLDEVSTAFDATQERRMEANRPALDDPVAYMVVKLRGGGGMRSMGSVLKGKPADPLYDTYEPREGPGYLWRRTGAPCAPCNERKRTGHAGALNTVAMEHSCGEPVPLAPILKAEWEKRHDEAVEQDECLRCFGAGFVWSYSKQGKRVATDIRGEMSFRDLRGVRYLVACVCRDVRATA